MNMFVTRLVLFLFLSSAALVRRAQNEFYKNDGQNPLRGLFNFEGGNVANGKDSFDEVNIPKIIGILQNNIKQWSFIESQLLEPNVNLGMPEIFIPLKHLTTTLEILGNIFFAQNDLAAAKSSLERACPLMELLPANLLSDEDFSQVAGEVLGDHGYRLDPAELSSYLWIGGDIGADINRALLQANSQGQGQGVAVEGAERSSYATGCFSLLRDVYTKLYGDSLPPPPGQDEPETVETTEVPASTATETPSHGARRHDNTVKSSSPQPQEYSSSNLKYSSHQGGYNSYLLPNGKPREFNLKYLLSKRQQRQQMKQRALYSRFNNSAGSGLSRAARGVSGAGSSGSSTGGGVRMHSEDAGMSPLALQTRSPRSTKVSGAKLSMAAATAGSAYLEKSMAAQLQDKNNDENDKDEKNEEQGHRRRNHDLLQGVDGDFLYDTSANADSDTSSNTPSGAKKAKSTPSTPRRTSVFSGADEEEVELTAPLMPATVTPVVSTGTERQPSPLRGPSHADKHRHHQQQEQTQKVQKSVKTQKPSPAQNFDFEQKLRDLRSPYEHLRSELQLVQGNSQGQAQGQGQNPAKRPASATPSRRDSDIEFVDDADETRSGSAGSGSGSGGGRRVGLGLSSSSNRSKPQAQKASPSGSAATPKPAVRGFEGSSLNSINGEDITAPGVSTSVIADDLELLLRQFVAADRKTRKELLLLARKYYDELDINYPNMDYNEYAANMDVGQAYLEVMGRAAEEGFAFINAELEVWKATTAEAHRKHVSEKYDTAKKSLENKLGGSVQAKKGAGGSGGETKGKSKSKGGKKDASSTTTTPTPSSSPPLQVTLAERNRLLVLYAFDIVHTDPSDPFDLGLGFNRGIVDNDRSRRGDHFMSDVLHEAIVTMGLDGALGGILGTNSADDAHKRLFPQDGSSHSIGASDHLTEQHLRELLSEGGAEEYMAARSSAAKSKAAKNRRRKQRAAQVEGGGEYTREESDAAHRSTGGSSGGGSTSGGSSSSNYFEKDFKDGAGDLFDDEMLAASFRSSVPSIEGDWTLALFVLFMLLTGAVVYSAYQEAARKKAAASRSRLRQGGGAGAKQKASLLSGTGLVDFMYAQLNGAAGEDGESESSGGGSGGSGGGNVGGDSGSGSGPLRQLSSLLFPTKQDSIAATSSGGGSKVGTPNGSTTNSNSNGSGSSSNAKAKKAARESALAAQQQQLVSADSSATTTTAPSTLLGDILSYIPGSAARNAPSNSASNSANSGGGAEGERGATKNSESSKQPSKSDRDSAEHITSKTGTKEKDGSGVQHGTSNTSTTSGKGKNTKKSNSAASSKSTTNTTNATTNPTTNTTTTSSTSNNSTTLPRTTSNTTLNSSNGSSDDESTDSYVHPVALGNRRVSWAGLIPGTTQSTNPTSNTTEGVFEEVEQGDWAEARKKGSKRSSGANSNGTAEEGGNGGSVKPERIALGLKDSPLYRQPGGGRGSGGGSFPPRSQQPFANNNTSTASNTTTSTNKPFNGAANAGAGAVPGGVSSRPSASQLAAAQYAHTTTHTTGTAASATTDTAVPYSRAAAAGTTTTANSSTTSSTTSGGRAGKMYDLSEAKRLAEQMGGWSAPITSGGIGGGSASGTGTGGDVSPKSAASGPPGLQVRGAGSSTHPSIATATSPLHAGLSTPPPLLSPSNTTSNTPSNTTSSFGFSQLDLSAAGYSSTTGVWGTSLALNGISGVSGVNGGSGASSNPSLASLAASLSATANTGTTTNATASTASASNNALAAQSAAYAKHKKDGSNGTTSGGRSGSAVSGAELSHSTYLGDLVSYLDSSTLSTTGTSGATLPYSTSAATAASLYTDPYRSASSLYATNTSSTTNGAVSGGNAGAGTSAEADSAVLSAEYDHLDDGYYHVPSSTHTADDLYYNHQYAYDTALYNTNTTANSTHEEVYSYDYDTTSYGEYNYTEPSTTTTTTTTTSTTVRRDHGGPRQTPLAQPSADFAPSITLEASSLYGLSPDAPSFRPSRATASTGSSSASGGGGANSGSSGSSRLSAFSSRYEPSLSSLTDIIGASGVGSTSTGASTTSGGVGGGFGLGLFSDSSILQPTMLQPSASSALHVPLSSSALHSTSQALFNSDDFYESILIDSILGGEEGEADDEPHHD